MVPAAREAVEQAADTKRIYLRCDPEELHRRIAADAASSATRPNLTNLGGGVEEIRAVLAEREPVYRAVADAEFDVTRVSVDETVRWLIKEFL
jgi:shikimate kinase